MVPDKLRTSILVVALAAALVVAGGVAGASTAMDQTDESPDTQSTDDASTAESSDDADVVSEFKERVSSLETLSMTQTMSMETDGNHSSTTETKLSIDFEDTQVRREVVNSSYGSDRITVRNESQSVTYDPEDNTVTRYNTSGSTVYTPVKSVLDASEIIYEDRERVDGESTYRLTVVPNQSAGPDTNATLWIDTDTHFPTKVTVSPESEDLSYSMTMTFSNVSLNTEIPDSRFSIDIPDNATEPQHTMPDTESYDSLEELRDAANVSVPDPDVPGNYSFDEGRITDGDDYYSVSLTYSDGSDTLSVSKHPATGYNFSDNEDFESVDLGDQTGWYNEFDDTGMVAWECGDHSYSIYGKASKADLTDTARSMVCA